MIRKIIFAAAISLCASSAMAATPIGTFGDGVEFSVIKMKRGIEASAHFVEIDAFYEVTATGKKVSFKLNIICRKPATIFVDWIEDQPWVMKLEEQTQWATRSPISGGFFAIHDKYCTGRYQDRL
ncbi:hypothetical protein FG93_01014 [Bosea sp. LC85]|uniref:hypothetical protein n=1 Tax=Bosea sp. LC85 TaxID=1502851 RepID=UPI0004E29885|nr:hypothetical protein [Bosea sp. LC85]KFC74835.1 hypothetical protein FG93_01014 [Bosea sp. LC85]